MNPLLIGILAFIGVATLVGGAVMLFSQPQTSRLEDRLDLLTGAASPANKENPLKDNSVLARPLDDAPTMLAQLAREVRQLRSALRAGRHVAHRGQAGRSRWSWGWPDVPWRWP